MKLAVALAAALSGVALAPDAAGAVGACETVSHARAQHDPARADRRVIVVTRYSHSIVPGGLDVMSSTTRLTSRSSLIMRDAICSSRS